VPTPQDLKSEAMRQKLEQIQAEVDSRSAKPAPVEPGGEPGSGTTSSTTGSPPPTPSPPGSTGPSSDETLGGRLLPKHVVEMHEQAAAEFLRRAKADALRNATGVNEELAKVEMPDDVRGRIAVLRAREAVGTPAWQVEAEGKKARLQETMLTAWNAAEAEEVAKAHRSSEEHFYVRSEATLELQKLSREILNRVEDAGVRHKLLGMVAEITMKVDPFEAVPKV
jgi:hypothetical protein